MPYEFEHVTPYIYNHKNEFKVITAKYHSEEIGREDIKVSVDTREDYERVNFLQSFTLFRKTCRHSFIKALMFVGKREGIFTNHHFIEAIFIQFFPRQTHQIKITEKSMQGFSFAQSPHIMEACIEQSCTSTKSL